MDRWRTDAWQTKMFVSSHLILEPVDRDDIEFYGLDTLEDDEPGQETAIWLWVNHK